MPFIVVHDESACPVSKPWGTFTETAHGSGKTSGPPHGCFPSHAAALEQAKALYANVPEAARSVAPAPPNLRSAEPDQLERCGSCKMFDADRSVCWGYGNFAVKPNEVCDSYSPETKADETKSAGPTEVLMTATASPAFGLTPNTTEWRQTRAREMSDSQRRRAETRETHAPLELRDEVREMDPVSGLEKRTRTLRSYASLFNTSYSVGSQGYRFEESVRSGAFKRSLAQNPDVVYRLDHKGPPLARSSNALGHPPTLTLGEDQHGLWYEAVLDLSDPDVQALIPKIERGDLSESSFAFRCVRDTWNEDYSTRSLDECNLDRGDVSVVTFGASRATGRHMLLRSEEEALQQLREMPPERLVSAFMEWRDATLFPVEERHGFMESWLKGEDVTETRLGKVLSSSSLEVLRRVLELLTDADQKLDLAQPMLADLMGIPNPDPDASKRPSGSAKDLTGAEQLDRVVDRSGEAEAEGRDAKSPLRNDHVRSAPHLLDTVLTDLAHARQHSDRLLDADVIKNEEGLQFNVEHVRRHLDSAQEHAVKLDNHLAEHPTDPEVHRTEREQLSAQRAEETEPSEERDLMDDYDVMAGLKTLKVTLAAVKACQIADPDNETDAADKVVMDALDAIDDAVDKAIVAQSKDQHGEGDDEGYEEDGETSDAEEREDAILARRVLKTILKNAAARGPASLATADAVDEQKDGERAEDEVKDESKASEENSDDEDSTETAERAEENVDASTPKPKRVVLAENDTDDLRVEFQLQGLR